MLNSRPSVWVYIASFLNGDILTAAPMRNPLASAAARRVCASATIPSDKAKRHNARQFIRRSMDEPPCELLPQRHRDTETAHGKMKTEYLHFDSRYVPAAAGSQSHRECYRTSLF